MPELLKGGDNTTEIEGAVIKEQGVTFAVVLVKDGIIQKSDREKNEIILGLTRYFPEMQIVLAGKNLSNELTYYGRKDISKFLANLHPSQIPWKHFKFNN